MEKHELTTNSLRYARLQRKEARHSIQQHFARYPGEWIEDKWDPASDLVPWIPSTKPPRRRRTIPAKEICERIETDPMGEMANNVRIWIRRDLEPEHGGKRGFSGWRNVLSQQPHSPERIRA